MVLICSINYFRKYNNEVNYCNPDCNPNTVVKKHVEKHINNIDDSNWNKYKYYQNEGIEGYTISPIVSIY